MKTAVDWLIEELEKEYNSFPLLRAEDCIKAIEMEKVEKLKHQLFVGKVSEIIGFDKTVELLKECKKPLNQNNMKTAVEWLIENYLDLSDEYNTLSLEEIVKQAKEMEKQRMIDLVQQLKDYTRESNNVLGFDEREASEFVDIFYKKTFKSE